MQKLGNYVEFHLNLTYLLIIVDILLYEYAEWKSTWIYVLLPIQHHSKGGADLCKSGKEYLNAVTCKLYTSLQNFETFGVLPAFPAINIAEL